jgi:ABC-type cobalamin transport system permease subunit
MGRINVATLRKEEAMNEVLLELSRVHQATNWILLVISLMDLVAAVGIAWLIYLTRDVGRMQARGEEEFRKLSYYMFAKLGPLDMK